MAEPKQRRHDIWMILNTIWPIFLALIAASALLGGRMETPAQKQARIDRVYEPLKEQLHGLNGELQTHMHLEGHPHMAERVEAVQQALIEVKQEIRRTNDKLDLIIAKMDGT